MTQADAESATKAWLASYLKDPYSAVETWQPVTQDYVTPSIIESQQRYFGYILNGSVNAKNAYGARVGRDALRQVPRICVMHAASPRTCPSRDKWNKDVSVIYQPYISFLQGRSMRHLSKLCAAFLFGLVTVASSTAATSTAFDAQNSSNESTQDTKGSPPTSGGSGGDMANHCPPPSPTNPDPGCKPPPLPPGVSQREQTGQPPLGSPGMNPATSSSTAGK